MYIVNLFLSFYMFEIFHINVGGIVKKQKNKQKTKHEWMIKRLGLSHRTDGSEVALSRFWATSLQSQQ